MYTLLYIARCRLPTIPLHYTRVNINHALLSHVKYSSHCIKSFTGYNTALEVGLIILYHFTLAVTPHRILAVWELSLVLDKMVYRPTSSLVQVIERKSNDNLLSSYPQYKLLREKVMIFYWSSNQTRIWWGDKMAESCTEVWTKLSNIIVCGRVDPFKILPCDWSDPSQKYWARYRLQPQSWLLVPDNLTQAADFTSW